MISGICAANENYSYTTNSLIENEESLTECNDKGWVVVITVEIGKRSLNCARFGFCRISFGGGKAELSNETNSNAVPATLEKTSDEIMISFEESTVRGNKELAKNLLNRGSVVFEEEFTIPGEVSSQIGMRGDLEIGSGKYNVTRENGLVTVHFPL